MSWAPATLPAPNRLSTNFTDCPLSPTLLVHTTVGIFWLPFSCPVKEFPMLACCSQNNLSGLISLHWALPVCGAGSRQEGRRGLALEKSARMCWSWHPSPAGSCQTPLSWLSCSKPLTSISPFTRIQILGISRHLISLTLPHLWQI